MKITAFRAAALSALLVVTGCNTPYNNMKTGERLAAFKQECVAAGYVSGASQCASERNRQFEQLRNRQIAAGVAVVALGVAAVSYCSKHRCGGSSGSQGSGVDWDEFYDANNQLVWRCREIGTGRFTYDNNCYGLSQTDYRWPSKSAWI